MTLRLAEHWVWDFWFAQDGDDVHLFFLHAPRSVGHPDLRHSAARIGHAVSQDLRTWELLPTALSPGPPGAFDDLATWTGSTLAIDGRWHMFYTGVSTREEGAVQRIGLAASNDLLTWKRQDLVLEADARWYEKRGPGIADEAWRDPWVFQDEETGGFHMFITARANHGPPNGRGVIGHATSFDGHAWAVRPPLHGPGEFKTLEVLQLFRLGGRWRVLFSAQRDEHSSVRLARAGVVAQGGSHYLASDHQLGPYELTRDDFLVGDPEGRFYAGRVVEQRGQWFFLAWRHYGDGSRFIGELSDPMPLTVDADGSLRVELTDEAPAVLRT